MLVAGIIFCALSCLIATANIIVGVSGMVRKRRGLQGHRPSMIHILSIVFSIIAYICAGNTLGPWVFIPAVLDPATFFILAAPILLFRMRRRAQGGRKGP